MSTEEKPFKHTMADPQFGKLVPDDFPDERDAIHIATAAVFAEHDLEPGEHIGLTTSKQDVMGRSELAPLGIVDPFLKATVKKGERFWVFLYPGSIRSLRHAWSHPAFDARLQLINAVAEPPALKRMKAFAASLDWESEDYSSFNDRNKPITADEVLEKAKDYVLNGNYWSEGPRFEGQGIYPEFWGDFEVLTGIPAPDGSEYGFFSCSC